ncbi:helix-turn-helix domain-containing protein [Roseateles flavus]|uniref:Helix-turn-helix transcriptional regulator n=1 Tax=Roseateles flavus TaxID=3149041 RepID=A0ABV0GKD8_9BURK
MSKRPVFDPKQTFLDLLRECRNSSGVSQVELAKRMGWAQTDISKVERGVRRLDVLELRLWVASIGYPLGAFVDELDRRLSSQNALAKKWAPSRSNNQPA